ncbi:ABC transporter permease [Streptomyces atratus]|uniref:ABC transporter permease n=1 Tax=Streptomyces atratus TaxID=1893 RepID=UPI002259353B|nr:ABC transporter permease [Streptomyces atratus]MCX5345571.1 ABC transporter permease [Streptomyces atratus]
MAATRAAPVPAPLAKHRRPHSGARSGLTFVLRRLGFYLVTAWAAITLNFLIPRFMPGDPAVTLLNHLQQTTGTTPNAAAVHAVRMFYGDPTRNLLQQYLDYWQSLAHLDFGLSVSHYPTPVSGIVLDALPWTVLLAGTTTVIGWLLGTLLGAFVGWKPGGRADSVLTPLTAFFYALPPFWLALLAVYVFGFTLGWFPISGGYDPDVPFQLNNLWFLLGVLRYGALPAFTLIFIGVNGWMFAMRNVMATTVGEDYVLLARAKGLRPRRVMLRYAARNALLPNVSGLALALGSIFGGVVVAEIVFTYPGLGYVLFEAVSSHDYPLMQTIFLLITLGVLAANLVADSTYVLLDPRTREER